MFVDDGHQDGEEVVPVLVAKAPPRSGLLSKAHYKLVVECPVLATLNEDRVMSNVESNCL